MLKNFTLNCNGKLVEFNEPVIMGILNLTADSFFDGGKYLLEENRNQQINKIVEEGAKIIDIGAMSSRPQATISKPEDEIEKLLPAIKYIKNNFDVLISIDTLHAKVAEVCLQNGADIINDISGGIYDKEMIATVAKFKAPFVIMHMVGLPQTMQKNTNYKNIITDIINFFNQQILKCKQAGIVDVILDIGIGFSKTIDQNYFLLQNLEAFQLLEKPLLIGLSNKSLIYKFLNINKTQAENGTTVLNTLALQKGANILRVHNIKNAKQTVSLYQKFYSTKA